MRSRNKVVCFVVECECALVRKEFVLNLHTAKSEYTGQFQLAHLICIFFANLLPFQLDSHRRHVLCGLSDEHLYFLDFLI
jgi:hypothetical protein